MKVVVFNEKMNNEFFQSTKRKADSIIPMGMSGSQFVFDETPTRDIDIICVGSLIRLKQFDKALRIVSELKKNFPSLKIEIVGDGNERKKLEQQVLNLCLQSNVVFAGSLKREAVITKMRKAKILLHTSSCEGQSTVISEALASGCYVVCFDVGRIGDHEKIKVCTDDNEMIVVLKKLLDENKFEFTPVIPFNIKQTVQKYFELMERLPKINS
jgi:glycosyltransferase involved in cell wall biosynthesis